MDRDLFDDDDDLGDELDLEQLATEAAKVQRRALDLDFGDVLPESGRGAAGAKRHGAGSLDTEAFLSRKEKEALERARGGTPTLDKLGKKASRRVRLADHGPIIPMDDELILSNKGLPGWAWAAIVIALVGVLLAGSGVFVYSLYQQKNEEEALRLDEARQRLRDVEAERLRRLQDG